jgi:spore coat polysaccharide biosynthesis protein SpsF
MKIAVVTQARINSTRLPEKVIRKIDNVSLLEMHLSRAGKAKKSTHFFVATTLEKGADKIIDVAKKCNWNFFQGELDDVLGRFYYCLLSLRPDYVVRITSDCPLIDPILIDEVINFGISNKLDYASNGLVETFPDGQDVEVFKFTALEAAFRNASLHSDREHVTPYIKKNSTFLGGHIFVSDNLHSGKDYRKVRLTVDTEEDFEVIKMLVGKLGREAGWKDYTNLYLSDLEINKLNIAIIRNEGYQKSLLKD